MADLDNQVLACLKCKAPLPPQTFNTESTTFCPVCQTTMYAAVFPAMLRGVEKGKPAETLLTDSESGCFYHPEKKAAVACGNCGRFLCALCDIPLGNQHLCPSCIEAGRKKNKIKDLKKNHILHDEVALSMSILPMLIFPVTVVSAPFTIFYSMWYWKTPGSILPRTRTRLIIALIIALLQVAGWIVFLIFKVK